MPRTSTIIVGAGQAGLALSHLLTRAGHAHVVLERGRIGERWRSERWASLALLSPDWANRLPGQPESADPDGFPSGREFVRTLERYAAAFAAPVREHTTVTGAERTGGGFRVDTDRGTWLADSLVVAAGDGGAPVVPWFAATAPPGIAQLHTARYRSPAATPPGGVLVVGAGPSGHQIAHELAGAGRTVVLAVGRHARVPRRYRGRDIWWWMRELGELERTGAELSYDPRLRSAASLPLDGRDGGRTLDLGVLTAAGVRVTGRLEGFAGDHALLARDLAESSARAEIRLRRLLERVDALIAARPDAAAFGEPDPPAPLHLPAPPAALDLRAAGIGTIVWATGHRPHHPWLRIPAAFGGDGRLVHDRGVSPVAGLYVLGARWQHRLTSHQIGGVGRDAAYLAGHLTAEPAPERLTAAA